MSKPIVLDKTISVLRPVNEVFAYIAKFSNIEQWDPAVASAEQLTPGVPAVGTRFRVNMNAGFSLMYEVIEMEADKRLLMSVDSTWFTALEEIRFSERGQSTQVRYIAKFNFPSPLALANRINPFFMNRIGKKAMQGMKQALEDNNPVPRASNLRALEDKLILPGIWRFTRLGYTRSQKRWHPVSAYMGNKHALITGATAGIGLACARQMAGLGAKITLVVRNQEKGLTVASELKAETGNPHITVEVADMSLTADVHQLADRLLERGEPIDILINNAGALFNPRAETSEGFEQSFALLLLGPYLLTEKLQPLLAEARGRVINVLSGGMYSQKINTRDLQSERGKYSGSVAYARAKRGLMIVTEDWATRWKSDNITVNAMHPGWVETKGVIDALPEFYKITKHWLRNPDQGADTATWLATATEAGKVSGKFWLDREQHPTHVSPFTKETPEERRVLLDELARLSVSTEPAKSPEQNGSPAFRLHVKESAPVMTE